jgi:hypothetical protein
MEVEGEDIRCSLNDDLRPIDRPAKQTVVVTRAVWEEAQAKRIC